MRYERNVLGKPNVAAADIPASANPVAGQERNARGYSAYRACA
jgi:hypothetical protein